MARLVPKIYPLDVDENNPIGISFPLTIASQPRQNFLTSQQVHDNLKNLILTMKGERIMQPDFGSDLYLLLFEASIDPVLLQAAKDAIEDAVELWMPAVNIGDVEIETDKDKYTLLIRVDYSVAGWPAENVINLKVKV